MSLFKNIEKNLLLSIVSVFIGLLGVILSYWLWQASVEKETVDLAFYVDDKVSLVEIKESLPFLEILVNGENILETDKVVEIYTVTLENKGRNILQSLYDQNIDFALIFPEKDVLGVSFLDSSSDYLKDNFLNKHQSNMVIFNKVIIESDQYIKFRIYVMGPPLNSVEYVSGKIAGIDEIGVFERSIKTNSGELYTTLTTLVFLLIFLAIVLSYIANRLVILEKLKIEKYLNEKILEKLEK